MLVKCQCKHEFQDQKYGKQMRVTTPTCRINPATRLPAAVRCTVCGKEHSV